LNAAYGYKEMVEVLLKTGANFNASDMNKQTPLHISVFKKHDAISGLLLRAGASINKRDIWGHSVLDYMHDKQRFRLKFEPRTLFKLRNWMYSLTKSKKHVESSTFSKTKTEHTETISATFTGLDTSRYGEIHNFPNENSSKENGKFCLFSLGCIVFMVASRYIQ
jgi:ankyrin repeat protein